MYFIYKQGSAVPTKPFRPILRNLWRNHKNTHTLSIYRWENEIFLLWVLPPKKISTNVILYLQWSEDISYYWRLGFKEILQEERRNRRQNRSLGVSKGTRRIRPWNKKDTKIMARWTKIGKVKVHKKQGIMPPFFDKMCLWVSSLKNLDNKNE